MIHRGSAVISGRALSWLALLLAALATHLWPTRTTAVRLLLVGEALALAVATLALVWRRRWLRWPLLLGGVAGLAALTLPGRPFDRETLRQAYVNALRRYEGRRYVWGGESWTGIDCSGLVRCGLIDAAVREGLATANPTLLRLALWTWARDASAAELQRGARGRTRSTASARSLRALDHARVAPGDLAVTANGLHVLAYLGDHTWIEADPGAGRVLVLAVPSAETPWLSVPVDVVRWSALD